MEELKNDVEQIKVQLFTGIKLGRVDEEWGNMIIETCNRALNIHSVSNQRELLIAFFMHFRNKGEQNIGMTIEQFVDDYLSNL